MLRGNAVALRVAQRFGYARATAAAGGGRLVALTAYSDAVEAPDSAKNEILNFHRDPAAKETAHGLPVTYSHLHVHPRDPNDRYLIRRKHISTGYVTLQDVIRLAITEFGAGSYVDTPTSFDSSAPVWSAYLAETSRAQREVSLQPPQG